MAEPGEAGGDGRAAGPDPVDWDFAERIAHRVAGHEPLADSYLWASLATDFDAVTRQAADLVAGFTGLVPAHDVTGVVLDRQEWTSANLLSFQRLLQPLLGRLRRRAGGGAAVLGRRVAGAETGALLGWFSRRVLGQYDLMGDAGVPGPNGSDPTGSVYYVGPNVLVLERRFGFRPRDFRLWIALHEVTHLVQFTGVAWLRPYFLDLVDQTLDLVDPDPARLARAFGRALEDLRAGRNPLSDGGIVNLLATGEQREVLSRVQALMSLLEGHGNYVMDRLGAQHVYGQERMSRVLRERRRVHGLGGQVQKALGLELKLRQYATGEEFFAAVEEKAGRDLLDRLWEGPSALPSLDELRDPSAWIRRVEAA